MSVTVDQLIVLSAKAITANFRVRNTRVFGCKSRHRRLLIQRRQELREWIAVHRIARDPENAEALTIALRVGPLMAHDLRRRVLAIHSED